MQAARWYRMAAEGGSSGAQYNLAILYERGLGLERDLAQAVAWYEKAADGGEVAARRSLSALYARGVGIGRDLVKALMWLEMAAAGGLEGVDELRRALVESMSPEDVTRAREMARQAPGRGRRGRLRDGAGTARTAPLPALLTRIRLWTYRLEDRTRRVRPGGGVAQLVRAAES